MYKYPMKTICGLSMLLLIYSLSLAGQVNSTYVDNLIRQKEKWLSKANFVPGHIIKDKDTISTNILVFKPKYKMYPYLMCVTKNEDGDIIFYKAQDIKGYKVGKKEFHKATDHNEHFFIQKIKSGKVNLFERPGIPSDMVFLYYVQKEDNTRFIEINPDSKNFSINEKKGGSESQRGKNPDKDIIFNATGSDVRFKQFILMYFTDCEILRNKIRTDFYTISDFTSIVDTYNNCF